MVLPSDPLPLLGVLFAGKVPFLVPSVNWAPRPPSPPPLSFVGILWFSLPQFLPFICVVPLLGFSLGRLSSTSRITICHDIPESLLLGSFFNVPPPQHFFSASRRWIFFLFWTSPFFFPFPPPFTPILASVYLDVGSPGLSDYAFIRWSNRHFFGLRYFFLLLGFFLTPFAFPYHPSLRVPLPIAYRHGMLSLPLLLVIWQHWFSFSTSFVDWLVPFEASLQSQPKPSCPFFGGAPAFASLFHTTPLVFLPFMWPSPVAQVTSFFSSVPVHLSLSTSNPYV